ncbi:MAG: hypothetical protein ABIZ81_11200 [Opitutaceae bacterium]
MKQLRLVLTLAALGLCTLRAQRDPEPIPDFSNLDEFIYEPKTTLSFGMRSLSGGKASFSGQATIRGTENPGSATDVNIARGYHDGDVAPDSRIIDVERNEDGTPKFDADGFTIPIPIVPDGKTNGWRYFYPRQAEESPGFIALHTYSATITDKSSRSQNGKGSVGMELAVSRDMGKLFNTRLSWSLSAGMTINDIAASTSGKVQADLVKLTDLYSLNGVAAPTAPYDSQSPPTQIVAVVDVDGNPVFNEDGTPQQLSVADAPILLASSPTSRTTSTTTDATSVTTRSRLKGAYYTFRAGPTLWLPISNRFRASISVGATLIYAGATYTVNHAYQPETGVEIFDEVTGDDTRVLPGYYADATMQFDITPRTGIYAGAILQGAGDYKQTLTTATANYSSKVEFGHQNGFRAGMTVKF